MKYQRPHWTSFIRLNWNGTMNETGELIPEDDLCTYSEPRYLYERFILVAIVGTTVAVVNIIENVFLCFILFGRKSYRSSHCLYLALLAFFDIFIAGAYIPLMSLNLLVDYWRSVVLLRAWFTYMIPMITVSHIAMTASSFLMVAASFERYCVTVHPHCTKFLNRNSTENQMYCRNRIAAGAVFLGVATKCTHPFEFEITYVPECLGTMNEYSLGLSPLAMDEVYNAYWRIWFRSVFTILVPFFLLASMNIRIVLVIQRTEFQFLSAQKLSDAKRKSRVRAATRTLVFVVATYLLSNVLNVIITIWEYIDYESITVTFATFYTFAVDVVSLLTIFAGALRPPIYICCQSELRKDFAAKLKRICYRSSYKGYNQTVMTPIGTLDETHREEGELRDSPVDEEEEGSPPPAYPGLFFRFGTGILAEQPDSDNNCNVIKNVMCV
ncbi:7 transmembrane receptor [Ancylostoma ceylanicum]|uniref:7 transmembrane receptor n=1 Tax=Ancylostoma ceylanicum TaxID=53326 RepID=A0A0D6L8C4_9BILA|nr:7 transmembrane receptor [Ancylostoma ceylanicum]